MRRNLDPVPFLLGLACAANIGSAATLMWVAWFNRHRRMEPLGCVPPAEFKASYYRNLEQQAMPV